MVKGVSNLTAIVILFLVLSGVLRNMIELALHAVHSFACGDQFCNSFKRYLNPFTEFSCGAS
jgi:type IV secretory pathway VirB3-like protein